MDTESTITSTAVIQTDDDANTKVMLKHFGRTFFKVETSIYRWMDRLSPDYRGGVWLLHELSNGGFWMHPRFSTLKVEWDGNGFDDTVSGEVAGLVACLFSFCHLAEASEGDARDRFAEYYHLLRDYALSRPDGVIVCQAID